MKRAMFFLLAGLLVLLVIQPTLSPAETQPVRVPDVTGESGVTNETVDAATSKSHAKIAVDASHGGQDLGYTADGKLAEKDINMALALTVGQKLQEAGYEVMYTRMYDEVDMFESEDVANQARLAQARQENADYLISIRLNNNADPLTKGFSLFTQPSEEETGLATAIAENLSAINFSNYEGLDTDHYANFSILSDSTLPSVLLELGYITNVEDYSKLTNISYQEQIGEAVTKAFLQVVD